MLPPKASSSMWAAAVIFRRYRPSRCPRTMRRCLPSTQTAVALVERQSPLSCRCRCLPSLYDAAVVVVRCRRQRTLPSSQDAAIVVGCYYRMPSSAAVVGCCGQGCLWWRCFARELGRKVPEVHWCQRSPEYRKTHSATPPAIFKTPS